MRHFLIPIILFLLLGIVALVMVLTSKDTTYDDMTKRTDTYESQRVFDTADVLTDQEESSLEALIAQYQEESKSDLLIYTMNESLDNYSSGGDYMSTMKILADAYYDDNHFGYEKPQGSGAILLVDFYRESNGDRHFYMSTTGYAKDQIDGGETNLTNNNLSEVGSNPYGAFKQYLSAVNSAIKPGFTPPSGTVVLILIALVVVSSVVHLWMAMHQKKAEVTTTARTYVEGGNGEMISQYDRFAHKNVTKVYSPQKKNSGGGGGGGSHGGGGGTF